MTRTAGNPNLGVFRVLGVDACKAGWVGIALAGNRTSAYVATTIDELVVLAEADSSVAVVAIDMPIGLPDRGRRQADVLAREAVGPLRSSVFITPVRAALDARHPAVRQRSMMSSTQPYAPGQHAGSLEAKPRHDQTHPRYSATACRARSGADQSSFAANNHDQRYRSMPDPRSEIASPTSTTVPRTSPTATRHSTRNTTGFEYLHSAS